MNHQTFSISTRSILKIILVLVLLWILWQVREVLLILFVTLILVVTLLPFVDKMEAKKVPRLLGVIIVYLIMLIILAGILSIIIPPLVIQIKQLAENIPFYITKATTTYNYLRDFYFEQSKLISFFQKPLEGLSNQILNLSTSVFSTARGIFSGAGIIILILVLTFYSLLDKKSIIEIWHHFIPEDRRTQIKAILDQVFAKWGGWVRGQIILCLAIGLIDFSVLLVLGIPYALTLGVWAGLMEIIPLLGPVLALIPAVLVAFFISPWKALIVFILYILVQQLESQILVPKIMQKAVGLSPIIIIVAILVGAKLGGILGVILAVPVAVGLITLAYEWRKLKA